MESVEELCHSIALLNLSHKILDGKVKDIKGKYRNSTYLVEYEGNKVRTDSSAPFEIFHETANDEVNIMRLKINQGYKLNDVLKYLLPLVSLNKVEEIIPTMNEIFIETVSKNH